MWRQRIVVEDGDIAARHVDDLTSCPWSCRVHSVPPMRDHVVIGMRAENDDFLPFLPARSRADPPESSLKTRCRMASVTAFAEQFVQPVLDEIAGFELE